MKIEFERTGGFTGIPLAVELNTGKLPKEEARELEALIQGIEFFSLPKSLVSPMPEADQFLYRVTVQKGLRKHTIEVSESAAPETLQPLLQRLMEAARANRTP